MSLKKYLLASVVLGLFACNDNDSSGDVVEGHPTYLTLSIYLPGAKAPTRALPDDYNPDGTYEGNDLVETLDIYMVSAGGGTPEAQRFSGAAISTDGSVVSLSQPFRTTSGNKTIYVVLNAPGPLDSSITSENDLVPIAGLAELTTLNGETLDLITMTGRTAATVAIEPDVSQQAAVGGANNVSIEVTRVASRAIVTTTASNLITDTAGVVIGTISNITYSVAQGTNQIYAFPQTDYTTWGSDFVPATDTEYISEAPQYYDYSDLSNQEPVPVLPAGTGAYKALPGKFLFENTHTYGADTRTTEYRKGNTAYILVKAVLTPAPSAIADGGTLTNGTFYVGQSDGLIYANKQNALNAVQNQKVATYQQGEMLYYAWLNPDNIALPLNSPIIRNNIYHVNITGFSGIGYNWNPLYPEDPDTPNPENPDPKPVNPDEPDPPVDPIDPLTPEQTYMTVEVTVQDWLVHSYDIEF